MVESRRLPFGEGLVARRLRRLDAPAGVAVWWVDLDVALEETERRLLGAAEAARAQRFVRPLDAQRYRVAHWALRWLVAEALARPIADVDIVADARGRPVLPADPRCHLSLSHSAGQGLVALSRGAPVGVDIEVQRALPDADELIALHGSPAEQEVLRRCDRQQRASSFLGLWTRKEACMKALGRGLTLEPSAFDVGTGPGLSAVTVFVEGRRQWLEVGSLTGLQGSVGAWACVGGAG